MASLTERLALLVEMNPEQAVKGLTKIGETAEKQLSKVDTKTAKIGKSMSKLGVGMIGVGAVIGGVLVEMAEKAGKAELAEIKLDNSVKNSSNQAKGSAEEYEKLAKSIQSKTAASRIDIIAGEATLVQFGATTAQVKGLTPLVVDLARKQGLDLTQANKLVGKALEGSTGALKKAGIVVDETAFATDRYKAIVDALRHTVGGFAETEGSTFEGSLARLHNELTDIEAGVGKGAVDAFTQLLKPVESLSAGFENLSPQTQESVGKIGAYSAAGLIAVGTTATLVGKLMTMRESFAALAEELPLVASGLKLAGAAGVAFVGIQIANALGDAADPLAKLDLNQVQLDLLKVGKGAKASGDLAKLAGPNFGYLKHAIEGIAAPSVVSQIDNVKHSFEKLGGLLHDHAKSDLPQYREAVDKVDKAIAGIASQSAPAANQVLAQLRKELGSKDYDRLYPLLNDTKSALAGVALQGKLTGASADDLATSIGHAATAATTAGDDYVKLAGITGKNIDPVKELTGAIDGLVSEFLGLEGTTDSYQKDLNALPAAVQAARDGHVNLAKALTDTSDAGIALREAMRTQVDAGAKVIDSMVQQGASSEQVKAKVAELAAQFQDQAVKAGLPQPVIDHYLATLNSIPALVPTEVKVDTNDAMAKLDALLAREKQLKLGTSVDPNYPVLYGGGAGAPTAKHKAAKGAYVKARPGGVDFNVAEGGEDEVIAPLSKLPALVGAGASSEVHLHFHSPVTKDNVTWVAETVQKARRDGWPI